jgi:tetratricopeptide (TPR) repeat protein
VFKAKAIVCEYCGAKFRSDRDRCPRCRTLIVRPDPLAIAAKSRKLLRASAGLLGGFLLLVGVLWIRNGGGDEPTFASSRPVSASPSVTAPVNAPATPRGDGNIPFLDPSGSAVVAYKAGDFESARLQFLAAIEKNPNDAESLSNLGQVLIKLGQTAEALPHLQRAATLNPDRWAYRFNYARALALLERWDESIASYRQAQRLFPDDYVTTFNLAMTLHKAGNEAAAVEQYLRAIELNPTDASFRIALGISYERLQRPADAIAAYSESLRLEPSGTEAEKVRTRIAELTGTKS